MKTNINHIFAGVVGAALSAGLWSCTSETPFETDGTGIVHLHTSVNSITTRAGEENDADPRQQQLRENCIIYISRQNGDKNNDGLIKKWKGLDNVDSSIVLKAGNYVAEAWTGDSISASFDKIFYRGYQPFTVTKNGNHNVSVNCRIRNVVVSIKTETIDPNLMRDNYEMTIRNHAAEGGELTFTKANAESERAYFMMPTDDTQLEYTIKGTRKDGKKFEKSGTIDNVESAHHYIISFKYDPNQDDNTGAAFIKINIKDEEIGETGNVSVATGPSISGVGFKVAKQQVCTDDTAIPSSYDLRICAFGEGFDALKVETEDWQAFGLPSASLDMLDAATQSQCKGAGLEFVAPEYKESTNVSTAILSFMREMIERLPARDTEYVVNITATDTNRKNGESKGQTTTVQLRIARSNEAIIVEDPIVVDRMDTEKNPMSVTGSGATITFSLSEDYEGTPGVEYRKAGEEAWTFAAAVSQTYAPLRVPRKAAGNTVTLTGLTPGTSYQYRACCGDFHSEEIYTFTTETPFVIPYADMETWNSFTIDGQKNCTLPGTGADEFWGNGNPGAAKASTVLTQKSGDMFHSASSSGQLVSQKASVFGIGKFAAGNLFAGSYVKTDVTDGVLKFGRPYNGTHPTALKVWVNYRPKAVEVDNVTEVKDYIQQGDIDKGQIYVALTTAPVDIFTKKANRKLFDPNGQEVLAYGEYTFDGDFGPDGQLQELSIPITYNSKAETTKPTHIVIVCSASKYGDYFIGGEKSTMYVDDFELEY